MLETSRLSNHLHEFCSSDVWFFPHPVLATGDAASQPAVWKQLEDVGKGALGGEKIPVTQAEVRSTDS